METGCIFCGIGVGAVPAEVLYEDDASIAFLDVAPKAAGHTIVVPKVHREKLTELSDKETTLLFGAVRVVAGVVVGGLGADGLTIGINQGKAAGQAVPHLHVHCIPRWRGDGGSSVHSIVENPPKESLERIAARIRNSLRNTPPGADRSPAEN